MPPSLSPTSGTPALRAAPVRPATSDWVRADSASKKPGLLISFSVARPQAVATACGLATLKEISKPGFFEALGARTRSLVQGLEGAAQAAGVPLVGDSEGGMFGFFFAQDLPQNYGVVMATDKERFNRFFHAMLQRGVYLAPALYEAGFVSAAHSAADIEATLAAAQAALQA